MTNNKEQNTVPTHIGFIMDGNRRWGKLHGKKNPITGTRKGVDALVEAVKECNKRGIKHITVYALSIENFSSRKEEEIKYLLNLFRTTVSGLVDRVEKEGARVKFVGRKEMFPKDIRSVIEDAEKRTENNNSIVLNLAAAYTGRAEIVDVVKSMIKNKVAAEDVTEEMIGELIYEAGQPDLDLVVRTGGMQRLSGFMLWQSSYSEMYFTDMLWPDFDGKELDKALEYYVNVKRNFGK